MSVVFWLVIAAFAATAIGTIWIVMRKAEARRQAEEARAAALLASFAARPKLPPQAAENAAPATPPMPAPAQVLPAASDAIALQKLLFEAAHKTAEAGEPALAIQLYARLLSRFPDTGFAEPARAAVAALHKKVVKS